MLEVFTTANPPRFPPLIMEKNILLNNLHEEVSCSVCMTTFTDPKQLPCLHSFCLHCLNGIRASGRHDIITCPECRRESRVPCSENLNDLPTNFRIKSLLDALAIKERNTTSVKCGNCDQKSSHVYCFECDDCITAHNIIRANKEHRVIEDVLKRPAFCGKPGHEKKELEFFCKKCQEPICNSCIATIHDGHVKILLEEAANERKAEAKSVIESQKQMGQQMRNKILQVDENCSKIREEVVNVKRKVQKFGDKLMAIIEAKMQDIFNEVENEGQQSLERLGIQKSEFEQQGQMIETAVEKADALLEQSTSADIAQLDDSLLTTIFNEGVRCEEQVDGDLEGVPQFSFVENETLLEKAITEGIGSVKIKTFLHQPSVNHSRAEGNGIREAIVGLEAQFVLTTRNAKGEQYYDKGDCVTVELRNRQGQDCVTERRVEDQTDGSYKISYFSKEPGKCVLSVKVNNQHVHGSPFAVQVKPKQFNSVSVLSKIFTISGSSYLDRQSSLRKPWGVAVNDRNEIAVIENGCTAVQIFSSLDLSFLTGFGKTGDKEGEFNFPTGIAFDIKNKIFFVADSGNHRVQLFSEWGWYLNQFGGKGNLEHQFQFPVGLSVDSDGNVIVADSGNKAIKLFSPGGRFLRKIGEEGSFTYPYHCVQYDNHYIVSDSAENSIKVFARDGNFL